MSRKDALYIYGITDAPRERVESLLSRSHGLHEGACTTVAQRGLLAITTLSPLMDFDTCHKEQLQRYVANHKDVLESLAKEITIVPMRFGMVAPGEEELRHILERASLQFILSLEKLRGKAEFILHVLLNEEEVLGDIRGELNLRGEMIDLSTMDATLEVGRKIFESLELRRTQFLSDIEEELRHVAFDTVHAKLTEDTMLLNQSLLIRKEDEPKLDACIQCLAEKHSPLKFAYWGPLPAYSFVDINLSLGNVELIDRARKTLGLPDEATLGQIRQQYHHLTLLHHPDKGGKEEVMKELSKAYAILENYCRSYVYSFRQEDVEKVVVQLSEKVCTSSPL